MSQAAAWAVGGGAFVVVGLGVAVAVLGVRLGRARADLAGAGERERTAASERDRAVAELDNERARTAHRIAELERRAREATELAARHLPPEQLRESLRDLLEDGGGS